MDKFSERLVALRKEKDLTQAEFARLCGKQRTTVSGYETEGKEPDRPALPDGGLFRGNH